MVTFNITYDSSVASAPSTFKPQIDQACANIASVCPNPVTVNVMVSYGSLQGQPLGAGAIGESSPVYTFMNWSQVQPKLQAVNPTFNLPATDPTNGGTFLVWQATAKALGLLSGGSSIDGYVGIGNGGDFDIIAVAEHEISEVMGRVLLCDQVSGSTGVPNFITPYDLFDFTAPGIRSYIGSQSRYFSVDNGTTNLDTFNNVPGADNGDWAGGPDPFSAFYSGQEAFTPADLKVFQALGWSSANVIPPPPPAPFCNLSASPTSLPAGGGPVTLSWTVDNATSASLSPDVGSLPITGITNSGTATVFVSQTTTFTLTAVNSVGITTSVTNKVSVTTPKKKPGKGHQTLRFGQKKRLDKHT